MMMMDDGREKFVGNGSPENADRPRPFKSSRDDILISFS